MRKAVDRQFLLAMLDDVKSYRHKLWAYMYYYGVRTGAFFDLAKKKKKKYFHYGEPRGRKELDEYMERVCIN